MARFEDYVKKQDELSQEIDDAANQSADRKDNPADELPERFRGKSAADIAKSYEELEKAFSRQGNDMGTLRKTVDDLVKLQSNDVSPKDSVQKAEPVSIDDLYENADSTIRKVATDAVNDRITALESELAKERFNASLARIDVKYDGWRDVAKSPEFMNWLLEQPYRQRMAAEADQRFDAGAAEQLMDLWYAQHGQPKRESQERERALKNATLESSSAEAAHVSDESFSRTDIINARVQAKLGNVNAQTWLIKNRVAIQKAYADGNITD